MENARNVHTFGVSFILSPNLSPEEKKKSGGQENKIPYGFFPRGDKFGDKFHQSLMYQRFPAFSICPRFLICPQNRRQMKIPFPVFRGDKSPETVDIQGFDGFCPRVDTENMGTVKSGDKLSPASVSMGTKARKPLIYRRLMAFVPTSVLRIWGQTEMRILSVSIFSFCPRLSPKQENRGQNGPFENARKMGLF